MLKSKLLSLVLKQHAMSEPFEKWAQELICRASLHTAHYSMAVIINNTLMEVSWFHSFNKRNRLVFSIALLKLNANLKYCWWKKFQTTGDVLTIYQLVSLPDFWTINSISASGVMFAHAPSGRSQCKHHPTKNGYVSPMGCMQTSEQR